MPVSTLRFTQLGAASATGFQKAMSFGQTPHSDAVCTQMGGKSAAPVASAPTCNALNKAAVYIGRQLLPQEHPDMKTPALLFCVALAFPFAAVACPIGMQFNGNGCSPPYEYTGWDMLGDRRAAIDAIGADRPRSNGRVRSKEELAHLERLRLKIQQEKEIKLEKLAKGEWGVESTSTPEGNLCAATFAKQSTSNEGVIGGMVTIMGFQQPKPDAWLMFHGAGLPKPRAVEKLKITLQQDDEPAQTVQVFNYRYGTSREMGVVAFAVPGLAAALDGMRDKQSFKLSLDGKPLMAIQWTDGAKVIKQLKQCAK